MIAYLLWHWTGRNWFDRNLTLKEIERRLAEVRAQKAQENGNGHIAHTTFNCHAYFNWLSVREARLNKMREQAMNCCQ